MSAYTIWGCNFSIKKSVLLEIGGFHPDGMPKEQLLYRGDGEIAVARKITTLGHKSLYNPNVLIHHWVPTKRMTYDYIYEWAYRAGISSSYSRIREKNKIPNIHFIHLLKEIRHIRITCKVIKNKTERKTIQNNYIKGLIKGYKTHVKAVKKDRSLLQWILKESYLV